MNYRFAILLSLLLTSMILPSKRAFTDTILADIVADFSTNGTNPDNNWSHGQYMGSAGIAYTPADFELLPNWSLNSKMFYQDVSSSGYYALIQKRDVTGITGNWIYSVPDTLLPGGTAPAGGQGCWNVSRWTSDYAGQIQIDMSCFRAAGTIEVGVSVDGTIVWSTSSISTDKYNPDTIAFNTNVNIGSTVDFYVNPGTSRSLDGFFYQAQISEIPEPVTISSVISSLFVIGIKRKRKN